MPTIREALALAVQYHQHGALAQAEQIYRQILHVDPRHPDALHLLGLIAHQVGQHELAVDYMRQALSVRPGFAEAHCNLGNALKAEGKAEEALASYREAIHLKPDFAQAHSNLGAALCEVGKLDEAVYSYRQALRLRPDLAEAHSNLGNALKEQGKLEDAAASQRQAIRLHPDFAEAHSNLGAALCEQGKLEEAIASQRQALRLKPGFVEALTGLGVALGDQGKVEEAVASYQQALRLKPDYADAHKNLAMTWLLMGNFEHGWREYEWRWKCKEFSLPSFRQPLWNGSPLEGQTILLHAEQGLGDTLQFIRYAPLVKERGCTVLVGCPAALVRLLTNCPGIDRLIPSGGPPPHFDIHTPLLSLPGIMGTSLATIPAQVPYLSAETRLIEHWRRGLNQISTYKIGIAWQGSPTYRRDRSRSVPLTHFAPLARLAGMQLFSLQKGAGTEQLRGVAGRFPVTDLGSKLDETSGAFTDTAAVMKNLDLVITSDTAIAHLAGALAIPVWVVLPFVPDFRWLLHREDSPWYPTMRLFRQIEPGNWEEVFERMAGELRRKVAATPRQ